MREEEFITSSCSALFSSTRSTKLRETPGQAGFKAVLLSRAPCSCSLLLEACLCKASMHLPISCLLQQMS